MVVNGADATISTSTRAKILQAVEALGYVANPAARGLRGSPTKFVGVVAKHLRRAALVGMVEALVETAAQAGLYILVADASGNATDALNLVALFKSRLCDALVFVGDLRDEQVLWERLGEVALPTVGLFQGSRKLPLYNVSVDNKKGATAALVHLYELGHRSIAYVDAVGRRGPAERRQVYQRFARQRHLAPRVTETDGSADGGEEALDRLLDAADPPTAIFAATDEVAVGILARAYARDISVPGELSVVGFDDIPLASHLAPPLTTVRQPLAQLADAAIKAIIDGQAAHPSDVEVTPELIIRRSTGPPPALDK